jgi:hypothetical protein
MVVHSCDKDVNQGEYAGRWLGQIWLVLAWIQSRE